MDEKKIENNSKRNFVLEIEEEEGVKTNQEQNKSGNNILHTDQLTKKKKDLMEMEDNNTEPKLEEKNISYQPKKDIIGITWNNEITSKQNITILFCNNCKTKITPLWRRNETGQILCNACGLFLKLHGRSRPIFLKTDIIKSRNRIKSQSSEIPPLSKLLGSNSENKTKNKIISMCIDKKSPIMKKKLKTFNNSSKETLNACNKKGNNFESNKPNFLLNHIVDFSNNNKLTMSEQDITTVENRKKKNINIKKYNSNANFLTLDEAKSSNNSEFIPKTKKLLSVLCKSELNSKSSSQISNFDEKNFSLSSWSSPSISNSGLIFSNNSESPLRDLSIKSKDTELLKNNLISSSSDLVKIEHFNMNSAPISMESNVSQNVNENNKKRLFLEPNKKIDILNDQKSLVSESNDFLNNDNKTLNKLPGFINYTDTKRNDSKTSSDPYNGDLLNNNDSMFSLNVDSLFTASVFSVPDNKVQFKNNYLLPITNHHHNYLDNKTTFYNEYTNQDVRFNNNLLKRDNNNLNLTNQTNYESLHTINNNNFNQQKFSSDSEFNHTKKNQSNLNHFTDDHRKNVNNFCDSENNLSLENEEMIKLRRRIFELELINGLYRTRIIELEAIKQASFLRESSMKRRLDELFNLTTNGNLYDLPSCN